MKKNIESKSNIEKVEDLLPKELIEDIFEAGKEYFNYFKKNNLSTVLRRAQLENMKVSSESHTRQPMFFIQSLELAHSNTN